MADTLRDVLRRIRVKQTDFSDILKSRYGLSLSQATVNMYCHTVGVRNTPTWDTIRLCVKEEFGIEYKNSRWEVTNYGNEKENR